MHVIRNCFYGLDYFRKTLKHNLKQVARNTITIIFIDEELHMKYLMKQIELMHAQLDEIDKKIEESSYKINSPITSIPRISHFFGASILAEIGDIGNYSKASKIIKLSGHAPYEYKGEHTAKQRNAQHICFCHGSKNIPLSHF